MFAKTDKRLLIATHPRFIKRVEDIAGLDEVERIRHSFTVELLRDGANESIIPLTIF